MVNKIKLFIASVLAVAAPVAIAAPVGAQTNVQDGFCDGVELQFSSTPTGNCAAAGVGDQQVNDTVTRIINIFTWVVGVVSVIMIIVGGFRYITSGGDAGNVGTAKNTILYAIIGLIIVILAQVIVRFVVSNTTEVTGGP